MDQSFIERLPKCELHLHIEGCLEPELMFDLAKRNGIRLTYGSAEEVRRAYAFTNLQSFLDIYYEATQVLREEEDFYDLAMGYFRRAAADNVRHAEIFFDPQSHTSRGIPYKVVIDGLSRAQEEAEGKLGVSSSLILCFLRHLTEEDAFKTLREALQFRERIIGVGLDSSEVGHPPSKFRRVFEAARKEGLLPVAHAGEEGPPAYIREALDLLQVRRIDHGVRALEDDKLVEELVRRKIPLTVCPFSNVKLAVFPDLKKHNLKELLDRGLLVTVNSDDPAYFGGYLNENYIGVWKALGLSKDQMIRLARNSFEASFKNWVTPYSIPEFQEMGPEDQKSGIE